jgi:ABC-type antimicrobial peptide transport system permease subunit
MRIYPIRKTRQRFQLSSCAARWPPHALERAIEGQVASLDKDVPVFAPATMDELISELVAQRRFLATLVSCFGVLALVLASIGLYGVMAYQVAWRTNEIGLRMALGASPAVILRLIAREGMLSVMWGLGVGACVAAALVRALASQLFGVKGYDPFVIGGAVAVLSLCALLAAVIPARRAASIDPIQALRTE